MKPEFTTRALAKQYVDTIVGTVSQSGVKSTYTDYENMSDIMFNGECVGAIIYVNK